MPHLMPPICKYTHPVFNHNDVTKQATGVISRKTV